MRTSVASRVSRQSAPRSVSERPRAMTSGATERRLALLLAGTAQRRVERASEIHRLAAVADLTWLGRALDSARLLPLLGSRLVETAPQAVPDTFRDALDASRLRARRRAVLVEQLALWLLRQLEEDGVGVVALKGPHLAERLHGDPGMRASNDIDLLVQPEDFHTAVDSLERMGYRSENKAPWIDGLPLFEASLRADDAWRPPIDLHWRLHWYEETFSRRFICRCDPDERGFRTPRPLDELAALLIFWSRDGLVGLRHAADVGAWWDGYGAALPAGALDEITEAHPPLRPMLAAAALHADRTVGMPAHHLLSHPDCSRRRTRLAVRCADLAPPSTPLEAEANVVLMDALLTPRRGGAALVARHLALPDDVVAGVYDLPPKAHMQRRLARLYYAARVGTRLAHGSGAILRRALR